MGNLFKMIFFPISCREGGASVDIIKRVKILWINKSYLKEQRVVMIGEICSNV